MESADQIKISVVRSQKGLSFLINFTSLDQVDHSIVESFVQGGRMAITSRVYPKEAVDEKAHVFLFNNSTTQITVRSINVWQMRSITVLPLA